MAHELAAKRSKTLRSSAGPAPLPDGFHPGDDAEWQRLWLEARRREWRSLAIVPCGAGISTLAIASAFAHLAWEHQRRPSRVVDATCVTLSELDARLADASTRDFADQLTFVALGPMAESPIGLAIARAADAALLCVVLGETIIADAERLIAEIGVEHFVGSTLVRPKTSGAT